MTAIREIAILDTGYASYDYEEALCRKHGFKLTIHQSRQGDHSGKFDTAAHAEGILVRDTPVGRAELDQMPSLKAIVRYGVGYDNVDVQEAKARSIRVANVQGYANHSVSDHAMALMFACTRDLQESKKATFGKAGRPDMFEFHDKVLGIIGIGRIGSQFAKKASPLFSKTYANDPYKSAAFSSNAGAELTSLSTLLENSHVISLHCNLSEETRHMINRESIKQMSQRPVIINTARGAVIREEDLMDALKNDLLHSAGLDVYEKEPPGEAQISLRNHPRVIATNHLAWYSDYSILELQKRAANNLISLLSGEKIEDEL
jgi:D-3-phosphoglycerate dehydrogenase